MCLLTICMNYVVHTNHIWKKCQVRFYAHLSIGLFVFYDFFKLKKNFNMYMYESLCCTLETSTTL